MHVLYVAHIVTAQKTFNKRKNGANWDGKRKVEQTPEYEHSRNKNMLPTAEDQEKHPFPTQSHTPPGGLSSCSLEMWKSCLPAIMGGRNFLLGELASLQNVHSDLRVQKPG